MDAFLSYNVINIQSDSIQTKDSTCATSPSDKSMKDIEFDIKWSKNIDTN